jgi:hypothetical protein
MKVIDKKNLTKWLEESGLRIKDINYMPFLFVSHSHSSRWEGGLLHCETEEEISNFYQDFHEMLGFMRAFFTETHTRQCIISKYRNNGWFKGWSDLEEFPIYHEIHKLLSIKNLTTKSAKGLCLDIEKEWKELENIFLGNFCNISQIGILLPEQKLIIEPTHNFEILFFTRDIQGLHYRISRMLSQYDHLDVYVDHEGWLG